MNFEAIDEKIVIVVTNYLYNSVSEFENDENCQLYMKNYNLNKVLPNIQAQNGTIPTAIVQQIQGNLPISTYETPERSLILTYNDIEKNISLEINNTDEYTMSVIKNAITDFIDLKMSDVKAMGLNFISIFNLEHKKLNILNSNIETNMPNFKNNITFQLTLLLQLDDCIATYKIRKKSGGDDSGEDRIYQIDANFHFDISTGRTQDKINKIKLITENLDLKYYPIFKNECNKILAMNNGKEKEN